MSSNEDVVLVDSSVVPAKKKKSTLLRHWAIIDATGQRTLLELDKYAIMRRVQISLRDLRILDRDSSCTIMGRERAIVLKLEYLKMIITAEEVLLLDSMDGDVIYLIEEFQRILHVENEVGSGQEGRKEFLDAENDADEENESPFEFRALEVALEAICSFLDKRTTALETAALHVMAALTSKVRDEIERLMENDDDLAELYLSRKLARASSTSGEPISNPTSPAIGSKFSRAKRASFATARVVDIDVEELEMLLEVYFFQIDNVRNRLSLLQESIDWTENYINFQLSNVRNQLIKFELIISSASVCVSVYSLVAGILGMNIPNSWNNHRYMFKWVVSVTGTLCAILFVIIMSYARYQRLIGS